MRQQLEDIGVKALALIQKADSLKELEELRVMFLGKKGELTRILRRMGDVPADQRPIIGKAANQARDAIEAAVEKRKRELEAREQEQRLREEAIDVTLPGRPVPAGGKHPLQVVTEEIENIFLGMGFEIARGPEVELDYYNFEALNIPRDHPARDMQDSFYISDDILLRTHTSPVQIRAMRARAPRLPVRVIAPGRVYRRDDDVTHSPMFHQVEGIYVDQGISMADLKGVLLAFAREMYGEKTEIRMRPSYFPFTEPSAEVDVSCTMCRSQGCRACGFSGWLEILGAGMVHPRVLENGGYNPEEVSGFAFGMGIERIAMLKYGIDDIRLFFQNDLRFLKQFT